MIYHSRLAHVLRYLCVGDHPKTAEAIARKINLMIGDTKETLAAKTGRSVQEIYEDEVSAIVIHGDDIDSLEGWQWDLSRSKTLARIACCVDPISFVQSLISKRSFLRGHHLNTSSKSVTFVCPLTGVKDLTFAISQACSSSWTHCRSVSGSLLPIIAMFSIAP